MTRALLARPPQAEAGPSSPAPAPAGLSAACAVGDGDFHYGVAALANSLVRSGFEGTLWVGHRGPEPPWAGSARDDRPGVRRMDAAPGVSVAFFRVEGDGLLAAHKPRALLRVLDELAPDVRRLFFFDADIVVKGAWDVFEDWAADGVALCLDICDTYMLPGHPKRRAWARMLERRGFPVREVTGHFNSGFLGIGRAHASLLEVWARLVEALPEEGRPAHVRRFRSRASPLHFMDQDMLNAAAMGCDVPLSPIGPEAMDAAFPYGPWMAHAYWRAKPWKRDYLKDALRGHPPDKAHAVFWEHFDGPIRPFPDAELRRRRLALRAARLIGRFYARPSQED